MNLQKALYRKNNKGIPTVWYGGIIRDNLLLIEYGILGKTITSETINTGNRTADAELLTRVNSKRKEGYVTLSEVTDHDDLPVEKSSIIHYLTTYLTEDRQSSTGAMLPQLAKLYDNSNDKLFKDNKWWIAQYKINGLRGMIGARHNTGDLFKPVKLTFQSREGTYWTSLDNLEEYLLKAIPKQLLSNMLDYGWLLDGELYIPNESVNDINSWVKTPTHYGNKVIQYWCYDIVIPGMLQSNRINLLDELLFLYQISFKTKEQHYNNTERLVYLESFTCRNHEKAVSIRNKGIELGFEGFIGRDPNKEYQHGKRNLSMIKFKRTTDGKFRIFDIVSERDKREGIPLLVLTNDINSSKFSVHITGNFEYQNTFLKLKEQYINRMVLVEYGERSGVNQVPFHVKTVTLIQEGD